MISLAALTQVRSVTERWVTSGTRVPGLWEISVIGGDHVTTTISPVGVSPNVNTRTKTLFLCRRSIYVGDEDDEAHENCHTTCQWRSSPTSVSGLVSVTLTANCSWAARSSRSSTPVESCWPALADSLLTIQKPLDVECSERWRPIELLKLVCAIPSVGNYTV